MLGGGKADSVLREMILWRSPGLRMRYGLLEGDLRMCVLAAAVGDSVGCVVP